VSCRLRGGTRQDILAGLMAVPKAVQEQVGSYPVIVNVNNSAYPDRRNFVAVQVCSW
jgi:hypothetical protein